MPPHWCVEATINAAPRSHLEHNDGRFSIAGKIASSVLTLPAPFQLLPRIGDRAPGGSRWFVHLASRRKDCVRGLYPGNVRPTPTGALFVELLGGLEWAETRDVHGLEELVVVLTHPAFATGEHLELHAVELGGDGFRIIRFRLLDRFGQHPHRVEGARVPDAHVVLGTEGYLILL